MQKKNVLVIDIGNTSTSYAIYRHGRVLYHTRKPGGFLDETTLWHDLKVLRQKKQGAFDAAMVASVDPQNNVLWQRVLTEQAKVEPHWLSHKSNLPISVDFPIPESIGADRLANACGAEEVFGSPVIAIDVGTALTFDVVHKTKGFVGGVIAPGLPMMFDYMAERTALLPRLEPVPVRRAIGRSTQEAMQIGAQVGYIGVVRELLHEIRKEMGDLSIPACITGGYGKNIARKMGGDIQYIPHLTLNGLGRIWELNQ